MKKENRIWFWSIAIIILVALTLIIINIANPNTQGSTVITDKEWYKGNSEAQVTLIEYSDFQCPACATYYQMINKIADDMGDDVQVVFRHYPLSSHPQAELAARAAEAAGQQDAFWQMHDKLFVHQNTWSNQSDAKDIFIGYAEELSLDIARFKSDIDNNDIKDAVKDDKRSGNQALVEGTPTLFLNGQKINNPRSYDKLRQAINDELSKLQ
ncbi:MAG: thioredoxin domain-containing protein [Candidatus Komeilibacteria bacterium]|jgi:protein-disulfide isomerase|nr:thioredoxin domain-containing protein [Candidatus Komeilibacteria bacterium]MBT4447614.1 thioredoxin domain-containing protein [Candidatus Komeilibacteria bacterium]